MAFLTRYLRLQAKLVLAFLLVALTAVLSISLLVLRDVESSLSDRVLTQLEAARDAKSAAIRNYFEQVAIEITVFAQAETTRAAFSEFRAGFAENPLRDQNTASLRAFYDNDFAKRYQELNPGTSVDTQALWQQLNPAATALQQRYIAANPHPLGSKHLLDSDGISSRYQRIHQRFHPETRDLLTRYGFYDIFLVDANSGDIVYTVFKEIDFATNLVTGAFRDTQLAQAFNAARSAKNDAIYLSDFAPYTPSYDGPAAFMSTPIFDQGQLQAVLVVQLPLDKITQVMSNRAGLGDSGESYLLGSDRLLRSDSHRAPDTYNVSNVFRAGDKLKIHSEHSELALQGQSVRGQFRNYLDENVFSAAAPIRLFNQQWAIVVDMASDEALLPVRSLRNNILTIAAIIALLVIIAAFLLGRSIAQPISAAARVAKGLAAGDSSEVIPQRDGRDEICQLLEALRYTRDVMLAQMARSMADMTRIKYSLDYVPTNIMVVDDEFQIRYTNMALVNLFARSETRLKQVIEDGKPVSASLLHTIVEMYESENSGMRQKLLTLNETISEDYHFDQAVYRVVSTPIRDEKGQRFGTVVEWRDLTDERSVEAEVQNLIDAATRGDLTQRARTDDKSGFLKSICERINALLNSVGESFNDVSNSLNALAKGDLNCEIRRDYQGDFLRVKNAVNTTVQNLRDVMTQTQQVVRQAEQGDLSQRLNSENKHGVFAELAVQLNNLMVTTDTVISETVRVMNALALGDLSQSVRHQYDGQFKQMRDSINSTIARLNEVIGEAQQSVAAAQNGELQRRITSEDKHGFYRSFADSLNLLLQTVALAFTEVSAVMEQVSRGNLSQQVRGDYRGEFATLQNHINMSLQQLSATLADVDQLASTVADTSAQIAGGNNDMSQRTEQQASAVQQTTGNLQSLSDDIGRNARDTEEAQLLIARAALQAQIGGDTMQNTMKSMTAIRAASHQISDISGVIDSIAFQTNLLALNAAVEAARAGEHGRGFAVVAQEVRQLATRSAAAAKEIKQLLQNAESKVDDGIVQAEQMEATLQEIVAAVQQTNQLVQRINASSNTEAQSIREIAGALKQIEKTTEQNASLAEQTAAASVNLQESAVSLGQRMQAFRLS